MEPYSYKGRLCGAQVEGFDFKGRLDLSLNLIRPKFLNPKPLNPQKDPYYGIFKVQNP